MRNSALLFVLASSACTAAPPPAEIPERGASGFVCRADNLAQFAGRPASEELGAEMLRLSGARNLRWVAAGMMVTMEFSPDRLTVYLDAANRVERASCG